ncbi:MAG: beta-ketoacyl-[acyl-carrier-protein] synthase family protein [Candidatus Omnitrophica bacterium]|nr:beta-ketoacyl-[acyl-carrier-protein] synthase family protein [Candidatus Omnitrophota bacterium]
MEKVAITGIGIVSPSGIDKRKFWSNISHGRSAVEKITRFDASKYTSHVAGHVHELEAYSDVSSRLLKKIDVFSHMALVGTELAMKDAQLNLADEDLDRAGIFMGNAIGGWLFAETELRDLYIEGREGVSPFAASAWFPAAPQGQISIKYQLKGYSKTVVADRAGSLMAIGYGARALEHNKVNFVVAGGMEAPVTPYALLCCQTSGMLTKQEQNPNEAYKPFDKDADGYAIAEGAGIIIMESPERAEKRNAHIYGYVTGYASTTDGVDRINPAEDGKELARAISLAIEDAGLKNSDIDYVCLDGAGLPLWDLSETRGIKLALGEHAKKIPMSAPKSIYGNMLGACGALDVITTLLAMEHNQVPPTINLKNLAPGCDLNYCANGAVNKEIKNALVISRGRGGLNTVLVLRNGKE